MLLFFWGGGGWGWMRYVILGGRQSEKGTGSKLKNPIMTPFSECLSADTSADTLAITDIS